MSSFEDDPSLFTARSRGLGEYDTVQDFIDADLERLHEEVVDPMLICAVREDAEPLFESGCEIPLLPDYFARSIADLIDDSHAAQRSVELLLEEWNAIQVGQYKNERINTTVWRIAREGTKRQVFVSVDHLKQGAGQQTRAFIFYDEPPETPGDITL